MSTEHCELLISFRKNIFFLQKRGVANETTAFGDVLWR
jgi:hypothetical protein